MWLNSTLVFLRDFGGWGFRSGATGYSGEGGGEIFSFVGCSRGIGECGRSRAPIQVLTNDRESDAELGWRPLVAESFPSRFVSRYDFGGNRPPVTDRGSRVRSRVNDCPLDRRATARVHFF